MHVSAYMSVGKVFLDIHVYLKGDGIVDRVTRRILYYMHIADGISALDEGMREITGVFQQG